MNKTAKDKEKEKQNEKQRNKAKGAKGTNTDKNKNKNKNENGKIGSVPKTSTNTNNRVPHRVVKMPGREEAEQEKKIEAEKQAKAERKKYRGLTEYQIKCVKRMEKNWHIFIQTQEGFSLFFHYLVTTFRVENLLMVIELVQIKHCYRVSHGNILKLPKSYDGVNDKNWPPWTDRLTDRNLVHFVNDKWTNPNFYYVLNFNGDIKDATIQSKSLSTNGLKMSNIGDSFCLCSCIKNGNNNNNNSDGNEVVIEKEREIEMAVGINDEIDEKVEISHDHRGSAGVNLEENKYDGNDDLQNDSVNLAFQKSTPVTAGHYESNNNNHNNNNFGKNLGDLAGALPYNKGGFGNASSISQYSDGVMSQAHSVDEQKTQHGHGIDGMNNSTIMKTVSLTDAYRPPMIPVETIDDPNILTRLHSIRTIDDYMNELNSDKESMTIGSKNGIRVQSAFYSNNTQLNQIFIVTLPCGIPVSRELCSKHTLYDQMAGLYAKYVAPGSPCEINVPSNTRIRMKNFFECAHAHAQNLIQLSNNDINDNINERKENDNDNINDNDNVVGLELGTTTEAIVKSLGDKRVTVPREIASPRVPPPPAAAAAASSNRHGMNNKKIQVEILTQMIEIDSEMNIKDFKLSKATDVYLSKLNRMAFNVMDECFMSLNSLLGIAFGDFKKHAEYRNYIDFVITRFRNKNELVNENEQFGKLMQFESPQKNTLQVHESQ